jgi:Icc-related predicted phosphoesterase
LAQLNHSWPRVIDIEAGIVMVVTDLHGDGDAYKRYRDRFLDLHARGQADYLILNGDLIHRTGPPDTDDSLAIVLDVFKLKQTLGEAIIYLCGNHEFPHIYTIPLQKGNDLFTPRFEFALGDHRPQIISLFDSLPFYIRTPGGIAICHAGATHAIGEVNGLKRLFNFSHQALLQRAREQITPESRPSLIRAIRKMHGKTYNEIVRTYFAVTGLDDPRYEDFLTGTIASFSDPDFDLIWAALFTKNEKEYGANGYTPVLKAFLLALSIDYRTQRVLVTGHIDCEGGYTLINTQQLRLASATHAHPREAGLYLLIDVEKKVETAADLLPHLCSVFSGKR